MPYRLRRPSTLIFAGIYFLSLLCTLAGAEEDQNTTLVESTVTGNHFRIWAYSQLSPLTINTMHSWELEVSDLSGNILDNASIEVTGGMPEHDHGLPTEPRVTKHLGGGRYLLEGMKFHMAGKWQLIFTVTDNNREEQLTLDFNI